MKICERCGKEFNEEEHGSRRFCSTRCAHRRVRPQAVKDKIAESLLKRTRCYCKFCGEELLSKAKKGAHERRCSLNPNKIKTNSGGSANHARKLLRPVRMIIGYKPYVTVELDITYDELEQYRKEHYTCEICGKHVDNLSVAGAKVQYKNLCIDHDHDTNRFRGLLCNTCNRNLGWYENNQEAIEKYIAKNMGQ